MAESKYSDAERAAYKAGLAAAKKKGKRSGSGTTATRSTSRRKGRSTGKAKGKGTPKRASGCIHYAAGTWQRKDGTPGEVDKIFAWRYFGSGKNRKKMVMNAFPSKDGGKPQNGTSTDVCICFVANITIEGESKNAYSAVWSQEYSKLTISDLGLVANPVLSGGGYFGRGGPKYKDKVK